MADDAFIPPHPRFPLTALPSPLERAERLEARLRAGGASRVPRMYIKRDDLLSLAGGGNKVRNLEFSIGAALDGGATDVITLGRAQSNHCRLTAAACVRAGLTAHLVMLGEEPQHRTGNLLLDDLLGARVYFTGDEDRARREGIAGEIAGRLRQEGRRPYTIPVGGADARGALGHALAARELAQQFNEIDERLDAVVLATATGATQAGMVAGFAKLDVPVSVHGFAVHLPAAETRDVVCRIVELLAPELRIQRVPAERVLVDDSQLGGGYGVPTPASQAALALFARTEGLVLDPVYTAKAAAGLIAMVHAGAFADSEAVAFIHTGGTPALFA